MSSTPSCPDEHIARISALLDEELYSDAIDQAESLIDSGWSQAAELHFLLGSARYSLNQENEQATSAYDEVIEHFLTAIDCDPSNSKYHCAVGWVLHSVHKDYSSAAPFLRRAVELDPANEDAHQFLKDNSACLAGQPSSSEEQQLAAIANDVVRRQEEAVLEEYDSSTTTRFKSFLASLNLPVKLSMEGNCIVITPDSNLENENMNDIDHGLFVEKADGSLYAKETNEASMRAVYRFIAQNRPQWSNVCVNGETDFALASAAWWAIDSGCSLDEDTRTRVISTLERRPDLARDFSSLASYFGRSPAPMAVPSSKPNHGSILQGKAAARPDLPTHIASRLPSGWIVELQLCGIKNIRLKDNGWISIQVHTVYDRNVMDTVTKIPLLEWGSTGIPQCIMVLLASPNAALPIGFFDIRNGTYTCLRDDFFCRQLFDDVNGSPRNKGGALGFIGKLAGIDRGAMGNAMRSSTNEREIIEAIFEHWAQDGGVFAQIRDEFLGRDSARL